jgi:CRP/FNR family transcriptional regulator
MSKNSNVVRFFGSRTSCMDCNLRKDCAWSELEPELLGSLEAVPQLFRRGENLFHAGDPLHSLYVVRSGSLKTCLVSAEGDEQVVAFHTPGDVIALDAIADGHYSCDAVALDTASVCAISYDELAARAARRPGLQRFLLRAMSAAIKRGAEMVMMLGKNSAEQRMASFLLDAAEAQHRRGYSSTDIMLPMSRADIGNYLSLAVETVCRLLTRMQGEGIVQVERNAVTILDHAALTAVAGRASLPGGGAGRGAARVPAAR